MPTLFFVVLSSLQTAECITLISLPQFVAPANLDVANACGRVYHSTMKSLEDEFNLLGGMYGRIQALYPNLGLQVAGPSRHLTSVLTSKPARTEGVEAQTGGVEA